MKYQLLSLLSLFLVFNYSAMEKVAPRVLAADMVDRNALCVVYKGVLSNGLKIEINECTKQRKTRNANPLELHYSGKIGKKRLTRTQAREWAPLLQAAKQSTFVHRSFWDDSTD